VIKQRLDSVIYVGVNVKYDYLYNSIGQNSEIIRYEWNSTLMRYEKVGLSEYSYNQKGLLSIEQASNWNKTSLKFETVLKFEMSYDENNQLLLKNTFVWNTTLNKWELTEKIDYENTYNTNKKLIGIVSYINGKGATSIRKEKIELSYDNNGTLTSIVKYGQDIYQAWVKSGQEKYFYDSLANIEKIVFYNFSKNINNWVEEGTFDLKYNYSFTIDQLQIPYAYFYSLEKIIPTNFTIKNMITNETFTRGLEQQWTRKYYYSPIEVTGVNDLETLKTTVFPNPATDFLNIQWIGNQSSLNVELIDINGKKVFVGLVENNSKLPIHVYPQGLYLVKLTDNYKTTEAVKVYFK